ncbi:hypothetical protein [Faecalicatena orotica]|uniref:hypothetical protein n=1 Tax=Faecalicatena orotica TaxID=1544 RepID=UPI0032169F77
MMINTVCLFMSPGTPVVIERLLVSTLTILPVDVVLEGRLPLRTNSRKAFDWGGMLLVVIGEKMASTHIPL